MVDRDGIKICKVSQDVLCISAELSVSQKREMLH